METAKDVEKAFLNLNSVINNAASAITPNPKIRKNKPKLQVMSEEILKAIKMKRLHFKTGKQMGEKRTFMTPFCWKRKLQHMN